MRRKAYYGLKDDTVVSQNRKLDVLSKEKKIHTSNEGITISPSFIIYPSQIIIY